MQNWSESYRGTVPPWECDVTEHFTIAYYFDRLEEGERNFAEELGLGKTLRAGGFSRLPLGPFPPEPPPRSRMPLRAPPLAAPCAARARPPPRAPLFVLAER